MHTRLVDEGEQADGVIHRARGDVDSRRRTLEVWIDVDALREHRVGGPPRVSLRSRGA